MRFFTSLLATAAAYTSLALAAPAVQRDKRSLVERAGVVYNVFEHAATGARLEFVHNSGICETTPGVNQYSGYLSVGENMNMWFWFFEARQEPSTAPLAAWFGGGPGVSSTKGAFENGPCRFNGNTSDISPVNHTFSFNNYVNVLYIDQPISVGFSYGNNTVNSTEAAAPLVWKFIQAFYSSFPEYKSRDFGIFTESYGGHYGPEFAKYILEQNEAKAGEKINIIALGINNGWFDAAIQIPAYVTFSYNNSYRPLISKSQYDALMHAVITECVPAIEQCAQSGTNADCVKSNDTCYNLVEHPLYNAIYFNDYDIREGYDADGPPNAKSDQYLQSPAIMKNIGAQNTFKPFADSVFYDFAATGDFHRSFLSSLSDVVSAGVTTLIWAGDADWKCNWYGVIDVANSIEYSGQIAFAGKTLDPYTVNGKEGGAFKTQGNLSFLRVYDAGHALTWYQPELALQAFVQTMRKESITST